MLQRPNSPARPSPIEGYAHLRSATVLLLVAVTPINAALDAASVTELADGHRNCRYDDANAKHFEKMILAANKMG
jgi:hypothetical protein